MVRAKRANYFQAQRRLSVVKFIEAKPSLAMPRRRPAAEHLGFLPALTSHPPAEFGGWRERCLSGLAWRLRARGSGAAAMTSREACLNIRRHCLTLNSPKKRLAGEGGLWDQELSSDNVLMFRRVQQGKATGAQERAP